MPSASPPPTDSEQCHRTPPAPGDCGPTVAVAHYPEGAGHATRMLAVADELEACGADVRMAGGGAGARFVALNGYDAFEPTDVDFIDTVQDGTVRQVLTGSLPASANRIADYVDWLRETDPDALVTDDMFAAMAALRIDVPLYVLKHDMPGLYRNRLERAGAAFHTGFQVSAAAEFFYPAVWPAAGLAPAGTTRVPPVALEGSGRDRDGADVVVVPSHYSDLGRIATALEREGHDVIDVGSDDWEPVPSLLPYLRDADVVVCSGYSTVMDAAVAGTPCVVYPATDEQEAVADRLRDAELAGFTVASGPLDVLEAVADPPEAPAYENGAAQVATTVLDDLDAEPASASARRLPGRTRRAERASGDGGRRVVGATGRTAVAAATGARSAAQSIRRYALAVGVFLATLAVFTGCRLQRTGTETVRAIGTLASAPAPVARRARDALARGRRVPGWLLGVIASGAARSGRALRDTLADASRE